MWHQVQTIVNQDQNQSGRECLRDAGNPDRVIRAEGRIALVDSIDRAVGSEAPEGASLSADRLSDRPGPQEDAPRRCTAEQDQSEDDQADSDAHPAKSYADQSILSRFFPAWSFPTDEDAQVRPVLSAIGRLKTVGRSEHGTCLPVIHSRRAGATLPVSSS
jgi:hypothetical protein